MSYFTLGFFYSICSHEMSRDLAGEIERLLKTSNSFTRKKVGSYWVIPEKNPTLPPQRKFLPSKGVGENNLFLIIVSASGHPKGQQGLLPISSVGRCGCFWNDPLPLI